MGLFSTVPDSLEFPLRICRDLETITLSVDITPSGDIRTLLFYLILEAFPSEGFFNVFHCMVV